MILYLIIGMCVGAVAVDFALQNTAPVTVMMFAWQFTAPLSIVIMIGIGVGLAIAILAMLPAAVAQALDDFAKRREARKVQTTYETVDQISA
jgi:uncharacterized integral membrane protein